MGLHHCAAALLAALLGSAPAARGQAAEDSQASSEQVSRIQEEIAEIRGLAFKMPVKAATQSAADFKAYIEREVDKELPPLIAQYYGQIARKLGLYRGPLIQNVRDTLQTLMASQAAAYYDPKQNTFFVLTRALPELMQGAMYSHELYHGLQHQHFDLLRYMDEVGSVHGNQDALLARQAVVEGEATYVMTLWAIKHATGQLPERALLAPMIAMQAQSDLSQLRATLEQPEVTALLGEDARASMDAAEQLPAFLVQTLMGAYLKGLGFVFAVHEGGWSAIEKLYGERPPASTEQILHPKKWLADERPTEFAWPSFATEPALRDWQLLEENVLGEFQWRIVFQEHGFKQDAERVAAGWNGDRFAVLKRKDSDAMLLLVRSCWDSVAEATEFANAYRRLLTVKYDTAEPTRVAQRGAEVTIVEGGSATDMKALLRFAATAASKPAAARK